MIRQAIVMAMLYAIIVCGMSPANAFAVDGDSHWEPILNAAFEENDLEKAVLILVNENNIPVSDILIKARQLNFGYTRIIDALLGTNLSDEQIIIEVLQNNVPPAAVFNSDVISETAYDSPELIVRLLVEKLKFLKTEEESIGKKAESHEIKQKSMGIILKVCKSMLEDKDYTKFAIINNLCLSGASNETVNLVSEHLNVPPATTLKACTGHAVYGQSYISRQELPQKAFIVIGVDHLTIDDNAGRGVISPMRP